MIPVTEALANLFSLVNPLNREEVPLAEAAGRVLASPVTATRQQPPFAASAMDGYAVNGVEADPEAMFRVIGESAAGHGFDGKLGAGQCVRIFTGAPMPEGANRVIIQEDVTRKGDLITLGRKLDKGPHVRPEGADFAVGDQVEAPLVLTPAHLALIAAMNTPKVQVYRKPVVALMATGDELVMPGENPGPDQIISSNTFGLKALIEENGGEARMLPIARDNHDSLRMAFELCTGADLIVTIGGASVGDHDLVGEVTEELGMARSFYKVAMRPGKPLMAGKLGNTPVIGLPGNPVSAMVCGHVFLVPALRAMQGLGKAAAPRYTARLGADISANGPREHYMRAVVANGEITACNQQDSALLSVLAGANALLIRPVSDPAQPAGTLVEYLAI
ncbi:molybdopterin molybdotransferase [Aliiroseovarius crassostreae]|uniref:Molybdopterin molybdenumtransferase n=1 Tax=Aliiroseovarius crassostreae TaxID=154981 RepID=A0A0P7IGW6_9RHOB|nr:gephyrin-like molybdotransferase Glp [Aliiroseovarius crassostreae]KPN63159.1 molybdenum cofactor biosynthesis protein MoaA [Aliiroseovarius crassostreae]SFU58884.1 molybdopterin molybdotransferase [Aliiroseovarius crassostreae]